MNRDSARYSEAQGADADNFSWLRVMPWVFPLAIFCCFACFSFPLLNRERGMAGAIMDLRENGVLASGECLPAEWLYAHCCRFLGDCLQRPESETLLRLPAFLAALLTICAVVYLLRRKCEAVAITLAVLMLGGSYGFLHWARIASPEMVETALFTWILALVFSDAARHRFLVPLLAIIGLLLWQWHFLILLTALPVFVCRNFIRRAAVEWLAIFLLLALLAAAVLGFCDYRWHNIKWLIPPLYPKLVTWQHVMDHGFGCSALIYLPRLLLPWAPLAIGVLLQFSRICRRNAGSGNLDRELLQWLLALGMPILVLAAALPLDCRRSWENWLPLLPALTAICAVCLRQYHAFPDELLRRIYFFAASVTASVLTVAILTWPVWKYLLNEYPSWGLAAAACVLGISLIVVQNRMLNPRAPGRRQPWQRIIGISALLSVFIQAILQPLASSFRYEKIYWQKCRRELNRRPGGRLIFCSDDEDEPDGIGRFYLQLSEAERQEMRRVKNISGAASLVDSGGAWVFIAGKTRLKDELKDKLKVVAKNGEAGPSAAEKAPLKFLEIQENKISSIRCLYRVEKKGTK